jgi:ketosteroid isomerase-like protein
VHRSRPGTGHGDRGGLALAAPSDREAVVRRLYAAWNEGGPQALEPFVTEDLVWQDAPELPDAGIATGRQAALARLGDFSREGNILGLEIEIEEIRTSGDHALVFMDAQATGGSVGAPSVQQKFIHLLHFAPDGRIDRGDAFFDASAAESAFAAAGGGRAVR